MKYIWKKCYKFFGHPYRSNGTKIHLDAALALVHVWFKFAKRICNTIWIKICFCEYQKIQTLDILFLFSIAQKNITYFKVNMLSRVRSILNWKDDFVLECTYKSLSRQINDPETWGYYYYFTHRSIRNNSPEWLLVQQIMKLLLLNLYVFILFLSALICLKLSSRFRFKQLR